MSEPDVTPSVTRKPTIEKFEISDDEPGLNDGADEWSERPLKDVKTWLAVSSFMITILLANLDQTIIATALPHIASVFSSLTLSAWVATAYLLTFAGLMLVLGQVLTLAPAKHVYIACLFIFALGSLLCATTASFSVLLLGRAIAGCGAGGLVNAVLVIVAQITRLEDRTVIFSLLGTMHALASIVGPLIGGAFTDHLSWRWCFYINLPFVAVSALIALLTLPASAPRRAYAAPRRLDVVGAFLSLCAVVSFLLPMQWGGSTYPWRSPIVISLFVAHGVLLAGFIAWEWRVGVRALLPVHMFARRTMVGATLEALFIGLGLLNGTYYLPLWYQAQGHSATQSGIDMLPFMLAVIISSTFSGVLIRITGHYWHVLVLSPVLCSVGSGLLSSLTMYTPNANAVGFQILYGVGVGGGLQNVFVAAQAEWDGNESMVAQATTVVTFAQVIGGVIGVSASATIFSNLLSSNLAHYAPSLSAFTVQAVEQSVSALASVDPSLKEAVVRAYTVSVSRVFLVGVPVGALASVCGMITRNVPITKRRQSAIEG